MGTLVESFGRKLRRNTGEDESLANDRGAYANETGGMSIAAIRWHLRDGQYAWPGGYQMYFVMADGESMCFECAAKEYASVYRSGRDWERYRKDKSKGMGYARDGWRIAGVDVNYEDCHCICTNCNKYIDPSYIDEDECKRRRESGEM